MALQVRNVTNIVINGASVNLTGSTVGVNGLNAGEIACFNADGSRINDGNAAATTSFFIARGDDSGQGYWMSDLVTVANMTPATSAKFPVAAVEQHDTIGYDGTSGSLEALNNNLYLVRMYIQELLTSSSDGAVIKHFQYKSDASATQAEVAIGLVGSAINNFSKEATKYVVFKALCNNAGAATTGTGTYTINKGSKTLSVGTAIDAVMAVGDFIRLDESAGGAPAVTDAVYKIVSMDTTAETATLDRAYQSTSLSAVAEANGVFITAALGAAGNWGIDMLAQPLAYSTGKFFYKVARWVVGLEDFGTSTSSQVAGASQGTGVGKEIADMEWFMAGFEGETYRMGEPAIYNFQGTADSSLLYTVYSISFQDVSLVGFENNISPKLLQIAIPGTVTGSSSPVNAVTATNHSLGKVLNAIPGITGVTLT